MGNYEENLGKEREYLYNTLEIIKREIDKEKKVLSNRKAELLEGRREMWHNTVHFSNDFDRMTEINQYLSILENQTVSYESVNKQIKKYEKMLNTPYFGRFDFVEDFFEERDKIYIGIHSLIDSKTNNIVVYDWRAPISSIFYEYDIGRASYKAPNGIIGGDVRLKRQYKINKGSLEYFFDSNLKIDDEILQRVLSSNTSTKMKNIVETIQKEQNKIIRNTDSELLVVQGVAGSGKTSIALHRIAFLLYRGMNYKLRANNIIIISPNEIFSKYIWEVLPELGEENVNQITFRELARRFFDNKFEMEKKSEQLEELITNKNKGALKLREQAITFKGSDVFIEILNRLLSYYERKMIEFQDIYYDGKIIEQKEIIKNQFLRDEIGSPIAKRLKRIENIIFNKINPLRKERLKRIEEVVEKAGGHEFEIKSFSRLLSMKESKILLSKIRNFTEVDYYKVYKELFYNKKLFYRLSRELKLPENIEVILDNTKNDLEKKHIKFEDCAPLLYLKLKIEGSDEYTDIKQVVVDEAQDYSLVEYEVFKLLFKDARFTVLGDINQSIDKDVSISIYDEIDKILDRKKSIHLFLKKSYRSTYEISSFAQRILNLKQENIGFERHKTKPLVTKKESLEEINTHIIRELKKSIEDGYDTIGIICKSINEARIVYKELNIKTSIPIKLIDSENKEIETGVIIIPSYLAKGLEFDAVIIYNVSRENYRTKMDRRLLYIAATRALHKLTIYYNGIESPLIPSLD